LEKLKIKPQLKNFSKNLSMSTHKVIDEYKEQNNIIDNNNKEITQIKSSDNYISSSNGSINQNTIKKNSKLLTRPQNFQNKRKRKKSWN
jgi:hypothetical protein